MLKEQRLDQILHLLEQNGSVEVNQLCTLFDVTRMTIRRDLNELEAAGKIVRTHGGAVYSEGDILLEKPLSLRMHTENAKKEAIAAFAASTIENGDKLFMNSGTTVYMLARDIDNSHRLMVVTNGLNIATELSTRTNVSLIVIGGELRKDILATTGNLAENMIGLFNFAKAYIGVTAIGPDGRLYHASLIETGMYRQLRELAGRLYILADSGKLGHEDFVCVGQLEPGDILITDEGASPELVAVYEELGATVLCTKLPETQEAPDEPAS